jgi:predicted Zn-dependent protease
VIAAKALTKNRTLSGSVEVDGDIVRFTAGTETVEMPLDGLKISRGGHNNEQVFFEHVVQPGWTLCTSDSRILSDASFTRHPEVSAQIKAMPREHRAHGMLIATLVILGLIATLIIALIASRDWLVEKIADRIPVSWEQSLGDQLFNEIKGKGQLVDDRDREKQIAAVTTPLVEAVGQSGYTFQFHIVSDTNINAFAVPGGHIFIHTGLLSAAESPEEIAGVLAHEIAHVTERHGFRSLINAAGLYLIVQFFFGDTSGVMAVLADGSRFLLQQSYSRDFEREADDRGWDYLIKANIDPQGMIRFFKRLKQEEEKHPQLTGSLQLLNTHPASQERMDRLEQKWKKLDRKEGFRQLKY